EEEEKQEEEEEPSGPREGCSAGHLGLSGAPGGTLGQGGSAPSRVQRRPKRSAQTSERLCFSRSGLHSHSAEELDVLGPRLPAAEVDDKSDLAPLEPGRVPHSVGAAQLTVCQDTRESVLEELDLSSDPRVILPLCR
ncbi:unnamed protein product, partial [Prorocentrum cordatum]